MRAALAAILVVALLAACNPYPTPKCELTPSGLHLAIQAKWEAYPDVVVPMRDGRFDDLVRTAMEPSEDNGRIEGGAGEPVVCKVDQPIGRSVTISYPPRRDDQVWAEVRLYYDVKGRPLSGEFFIVPLAP